VALLHFMKWQRLILTGGFFFRRGVFLVPVHGVFPQWNFA